MEEVGSKDPHSFGSGISPASLSVHSVCRVLWALVSGGPWQLIVGGVACSYLAFCRALVWPSSLCQQSTVPE